MASLVMHRVLVKCRAFCRISCEPCATQPASGFRCASLSTMRNEVKPMVFQYSDGSRVPESEPASALGAGEPAPSPISKKDEFDLDDGSLIAIDPVEFERRTLEGEFNEEINDIETE